MTGNLNENQPSRRLSARALGRIANEDRGYFRYATPAVHGKWLRSELEARSDALRAGVAYLRNGDISLFEFTVIERLPTGA